MVFKRGLAEFTKEERSSKFCKAMIERRIISNYVFPRTKYICGGCGEVIPTSVAIVSHMEQCAAIAEIESGETVENSLFAAPDGQSCVKAALTIVSKHDPWARVVAKPGGGDEDKETKDLEKGGKKDEGKNEEEGTGPKSGDGGMDDDGTDAGSTCTLSTRESLAAALLSLNKPNGRRSGDSVA